MQYVISFCACCMCACWRVQFEGCGDGGGGSSLHSEVRSIRFCALQTLSACLSLKLHRAIKIDSMKTSFDFVCTTWSCCKKARDSRAQREGRSGRCCQRQRPAGGICFHLLACTSHTRGKSVVNACTAVWPLSWTVIYLYAKKKSA